VYNQVSHLFYNPSNQSLITKFQFSKTKKNQ